jgi:hypothetical protein
VNAHGDRFFDLESLAVYSEFDVTLKLKLPSGLEAAIQ